MRMAGSRPYFAPCCRPRIGTNPRSQDSIISWLNTSDWTAANMRPCAGISSRTIAFFPYGKPSEIFLSELRRVWPRRDGSAQSCCSERQPKKQNDETSWAPSMMALEHLLTKRTRPEQRSARRTVTIGLVNNMGDEALKVTERQFGGLLSRSAGDVDVQLRLFALKGTPRSRWASEYIAARYEPACAAMDGELDALIITGAQPRATRLNEESYWVELIEL